MPLQGTLDTSEPINLRPYQAEAVKRAFEAKKSTVKAATGTGKTIIAIAWLKKTESNALIIVPTQALIYQVWSPKLKQNGLTDIGEYYANAKTQGPVIVTTFASAITHPQLLDSADAVVVDEIHHLGARFALQRLLPKLKEKRYVLGLSSVPEREDEAHHFFLEDFPICYDLSLGEAMEKGFVSPLEVIGVPAQMTLDESNQYRVLTERIQRAFKFCGPDIRKWTRGFDPKSKTFVGRLGMAAMSKRKGLLSDIFSKKEEVYRIIQRHKGERVILFAESVRAIENIKEHLLSLGVSCETFHSKVESWKRMEILEDWGRSYDVLLSCRALEEGLDVHEVAVGILITSGKSKRQFIQRIGRVIRPVEGKLARFYVVYSPNTVEETYIKTIEKLLRSD